MARIRKQDIEEIRSRVSIADIVGERVALKHAGTGSMKGLCPFHDERTPSFHVRPALGVYHCFGCGESGDVYTFLQKSDHVSFSDAVEQLAQRIGYEITYEDGAPATDRSKRVRLLEAHAAAAAFFEAQLLSDEGAIARDFLGSRGFDAQAAATFGVGYAPNSWDALSKHLTEYGFTRDELREGGLSSTNDRGSSYDRFRGRVVWPIRDTAGSVIGFGARKLRDDDNGPKYLNSPETPIYRKQQVLYGLDLAKRQISRERQVVVVEGYTDVMAAHLAGVGTAVATCGTAFGSDHIRVIRRIMGDDSTNGRVIFTFDPDAAGKKAAMRAFADEKQFTAQTFVAVEAGGLDPCDLRLQRGNQAVRDLIEHPQPMFEFVLKHQLRDHNLRTPEGRVAAFRVTAPVVAGIRDLALRHEYERLLAKWIGLDRQTVAAAVAEIRRREAGAHASGRELESGADAPGTPGGAGVVSKLLSEVGVASVTELPTDPVTTVERRVIGAMLQFPQLMSRDLFDMLLTATFTNPSLAMVRDAILAGCPAVGTAAWIPRVMEEMPREFAGLVGQLAVEAPPVRDDEDQIRRYVDGIASTHLERGVLEQRKTLLLELGRLDPERDREEYRAVQQELAALERLRGELRARAGE